MDIDYDHFGRSDPATVLEAYYQEQKALEEKLAKDGIPQPRQAERSKRLSDLKNRLIPTMRRRTGFP